MNELSQAHTFVVYAWWFALGFSFLMYIMLDGADLGAGVFSLFVRDHQERGAIMATMAGTWDANETWLVVAGGIMFGTFPNVYGSAFHYLMLPLVIVLWSIMMRAVSLEFRHHAERSQWLWDGLFGGASLTTVFFAGMAMGAVLQGYPLTSEQVPTYPGGLFRFISPFSIWTGVGAVIASSLAGSLFIRARFKRTEDIRRRAAIWTDWSFYASLAAVVITVVWSLLIFPWVAEKWLGPNVWVWLCVAFVIFLAVVQMRRASRKERDLVAILWLNLAIALMWLSMMFTMLPWIVPGTWTIFEGASPSVSLFTFTLAMSSFLPVMLLYNWYQIWVFRARVSRLAGYGD
ncbi:cytochrome d ubiquinol oxidase subunit II [Salinisphaera sp. USBA-960]|uniref:cytochrome d ubiquinol oxidase subunit II n=1 Tax=Salinisphaera orenii TaxID=856731 RepID=UPI000DBE6300|nr:cytochrome d ubiquinol oxidase subunit II [Salifodinibacter halophilus]NNC25941.1 cytochrome d ubiquinol oxidase subunit II [Salifodinibacter halophilus]